jgi:hypothetical protein
LSSQEVLLCVTLVVIYCNDLTVIVLKVYEVASVLPVLIKIYSIPCHDRGHINVMLVLQSCTDSLQVVPGSSIQTFPTLSDGACKVEEDVDVKEEGFVTIKEEVDPGIKQEEIPENITFPDLKSEPDEVSHVCVCCCQTHFASVKHCQLFFFCDIIISCHWKWLEYWK